MSVDTQDWKDEARDMRMQGKSEREIAEKVGKAASTVHGVVKDVELQPLAVFSRQDNGNEPDALERLAGGQPIPGQMTIDGDQVQPYLEELRVDGTTQVAIDFGGKQATVGTLSFAGKAAVDGFYRKGDRITGTFEAVIVAAGGKDKVDKQTGVVIEASQSHVAQLLDLRVN